MSTLSPSFTGTSSHYKSPCPRYPPHSQVLLLITNHHVHVIPLIHRYFFSLQITMSTLSPSFTGTSSHYKSPCPPYPPHSQVLLLITNHHVHFIPLTHRYFFSLQITMSTLSP